MKQISRSIGGAEDLRPTAGADAPADKWRILDRLAGCAGDFGLGHRELNVLRALLSFLPDRVITPGAAVVFPSNDTLSDRLNGLPESTLRRQLARLIASGLVCRRDSPTRKRYARRDRAGGLLRAFGFDLSPLVAAAPAIEAAAQQAEESRAEIAALRDEVALLRRDLVAASPNAADLDLAEAARRMLRRQAAAQELRALAATLAERLSAGAVAILPAPELSVGGAQNERRQQRPVFESLDSPANNSPTGTPRIERLATRADDLTRPETDPEADPPDLGQLDRFCQEARSFFPEATASWRDVANTADRIAPMIGIPREIVLRARAAMGWREAAATVLCLLERLTHIRNPAGYLTHLTRRAEEGRFSLPALLRAPRAASPQIVS